MSSLTALHWTTHAIAFALAWQTAELLMLKPWPWTAVRSELPRALRLLVAPYRLWLWIRLAAALTALLYAPAPLIAILLFTSWAIAVRWRGTFNGGSDILTLHILLALLAASWIPAAAWPAVLYIAIQTVLTYFIAGLAKVTQKGWRNGQSLRLVLTGAGAPVSERCAFVLAWLVIGFECLFPLSLLGPEPALFFMTVGLFFHLQIALRLRLNRFFWVWLAAYPALYAAQSGMR